MITVQKGQLTSFEKTPTGKYRGKIVQAEVKDSNNAAGPRRYLQVVIETSRCMQGNPEAQAFADGSKKHYAFLNLPNVKGEGAAPGNVWDAYLEAVSGRKHDSAANGLNFDEQGHVNKVVDFEVKLRGYVNKKTGQPGESVDTVFLPAEANGATVAKGGRGRR